MSDISDTQNPSLTNDDHGTADSTETTNSADSIDSVNSTNAAETKDSTTVTDPTDTEIPEENGGAHHDKTQSSHSTGVADKGRWSTQRIAIYSLFVALAMAASFIEFPIMPGVPWLKYDLSGIICLVAGFAFGPMAAFIVSVLSWIPHLFMNPWGAIMSIAVSVFLSVPAAMVYKRIRTRMGALAGILVGVLFGLIAAIGGNLLITPIYAHMTTAQVLKMVVPILLPFNLIKFAIHGVVTFIIYKPISNLLNR